MILHIGAHRTATSSLQLFLARNRAALVSKGALYPYRSRRHLKLFNEILRRERSIDEVSAELNQLADDAEGEIDTIILSDEDVCARSPLVLRVLSGFKKHFDVTVVYTMRRQDLWLESWYFQNIKWQWQDDLAHGNFDEFMSKSDQFSWIDYDRFLGTLEKMFGKDKVVPIVFERGQMQGGPIHTFLDRIGLTDREGFESPPYINPSYSPLESEFMRQLPLDKADTEYRNILIRLFEHIDKAARKAKPSSLLLDREAREEVMARFAEGNRKVARRYFGRDELFLDNLPASDKPLAVTSLPARSIPVAVM